MGEVVDKQDAGGMKGESARTLVANDRLMLDPSQDRERCITRLHYCYSATLPSDNDNNTQDPVPVSD